MTQQATNPSQQKSILVVDDDPQIARLVRSYLEQAGYAVETAGDGDSALHAIRANWPDLVVLDLNLPGMDGLSVTQTVRSDANLSQTPILMLTARVEDVDRIVGLEMGADDYVTKPFNPREVLARVKAILRRTQAAPAAAVQSRITLGGLALDPNTHQVTVDDEPVALTPSEFDILHLFMRNPGMAFSRTQIIEDGLGYEYEGLERTVDSHIKNLRRKIEDDPASPTRLLTVFGVGYRLES